MQVLALDEPNVVLPFGIEPVPGLDQVGVERGQEVGSVEHEGGGDAFTRAGPGAAGGLERVGDLDDLLDLPGLPKLAQALAVPLETLLGVDNGAGKRGPTPKLLRQMERIHQLPKARQKFVMEMIETVLSQGNR